MKNSKIILEKMRRLSLNYLMYIFLVSMVTVNAQQNASEDQDNIPIPGTGTDNSAFGISALSANTTGSDNAALGESALSSNTTGDRNTACGHEALTSNTTADDNTAVGEDALLNTTTGAGNSAIGGDALAGNSTGNENTALGRAAFIGGTGNANSAIGSSSGGGANVDNQTTIGANAFITVAGGNAIAIGDPNVEVWCMVGLTAMSDRRVKDNITDSQVKGLEFITRLRPVSYNFQLPLVAEHLKSKLTKKQYENLQSEKSRRNSGLGKSGFIAQEVEQAALAAGFEFDGVNKPRNKDEIYTVTYSKFVVPLIKAVQEQQVMLASLENAVTEYQKASILGENELTATVSVSKSIIDHKKFRMESNVPNPFDTETSISYYLPTVIANARLEIFDLGGKLIAKYPLTDREESSIKISAKNFQAGIYIYSIIADGKIMGAKRMVVTGS